MKKIDRKKIIKYLMNHAEYRHVPACYYDTTEECQFSKQQCKEGLEGLSDDLLERLYKSGGVKFRSNQWYYGGDSINKYNDLDVIDGNGEFVATVDSDYNFNLDPDYE